MQIGQRAKIIILSLIFILLSATLVLWVREKNKIFQKKFEEMWILRETLKKVP